MLNWKTLGDDVRAKRSMLWFYGCLAFVILGLITPDTPSVTTIFYIVQGLMLIVWACTDAEKQVKYVKENFGTNYVRRSWWKPVGIGIGAICLYMVIPGIADFSSESANISVVKDGKLDAYPDVTVGQLVDNFIGNPQWSQFLGENDENFVNATGKVSYDGREVEAVVQFTVYGKRFVLNAFEMNGVPQDELMKATLFQKMYEVYGKGTVATGSAMNSQPTDEITIENEEHIVPSVSSENARTLQAERVTEQNRVAETKNSARKSGSDSSSTSEVQFKSLANGRPKSKEFIAHLKNSGVEMSTTGMEAAGTSLAYVNVTMGENCRLYSGGTEEAGQRVSIIVVETISDGRVGSVIISTPFDSSAPNGRGNDLFNPLHYFLQYVLPECNLRTDVKDMAKIMFGGTAAATFGKAGMAVQYGGVEVTINIVVD